MSLSAKDYDKAQLDRVRRACLYLATKLGDFSEDIVVVGGLVPSLLIPAPDDGGPHVGTMDLDLGLAVAILNDERYKALTARLREGDLAPDTNDAGNKTRQRWKIERNGKKVTVDFLIPPTTSGDSPGKLKSIEPDFAAIIAPGLRVAFSDNRKVKLEGKTTFEEEAVREIRVCEAGAFVVMKALAFKMRGAAKDAYDLYYVVRNYGAGPEDVAERLKPLLKEQEAQEALSILKSDFCDPSNTGPQRVAKFLFNDRHDETSADVASFISKLIRASG